MRKTNMHIHSKYSWDCDMKLEDIAEKLCESGVEYAAITDHVELQEKSYKSEPFHYILTKLKVRNLEIDKINEYYQGKIKLLKAIEIAEPHLYKGEVEELSELDFDFIMGSVHNVNWDVNTGSEKIESFKKYYNEVLKMIEAEQIDVIGHLDYINRYFERDYSLFSQIYEVMKAIKEHHQIIEINSSAQRRHLPSNTFPNKSKIINYKAIVGEEVTIGTGAHVPSELLNGLENAENLVEELGLKPVIYQKRKRINL